MLAARVSLEPILHGQAPFITAFLAVTVAAWIGGLGPGLLATVLSAAAVAFLLLSPSGGLAIRAPSDWFALGTFVVVGSGISWVCDRMLAAAARARVSEQRAAEQAAALAESEERARMALAAAQAGSWDCDVRMERLIWSPQNYSLYGLDPGAPVDIEQWLRCIHPDDREAIAARARAVRTERPPDLQGEFRIIHPERGVRWLLSVARVIFDERGEPIRVVGLNRDVTDQKRLEQEREVLLESERAARSEAERASRMKDDFVATLSHELRTPLHAILGWTQLLRAPGRTPEQIQKGIEVISRNAGLQAQLISDLLDVSRIAAGKLQLDVKPVELAAIIDEALDAHRSALEAKGLDLRTVVEPIGAPVLGDPGRLQQVISNLVSNAVKFTPRGGRVEIHLRRKDRFAQITVRDTGQGIDPDFVPHLFERFRQADSSTARRHGGLGLGLSIVKHLVEQHGGAVRVESEGVGRGATFTVELPCAGGAPEGRPAGEGGAASLRAPVGPASLRGATVLVVDDEPDARELVKRVLEEHAARVVAVSSAPEAFGAVQESRPDVLVSDIGMPGMDGYALLRELRAGGGPGRDVPAVALTAFARPEDRERALSAGYRAHLAKPVDPMRLVSLVASLLPDRG